ncbi:hypothetical protein D3C73_898320 [compost metagenome]
MLLTGIHDRHRTVIEQLHMRLIYTFIRISKRTGCAVILVDRAQEAPIRPSVHALIHPELVRFLPADRAHRQQNIAVAQLQELPVIQITAILPQCGHQRPGAAIVGTAEDLQPGAAPGDFGIAVVVVNGGNRQPVPVRQLNHPGILRPEGSGTQPAGIGARIGEGVNIGDGGCGPPHHGAIRRECGNSGKYQKQTQGSRQRGEQFFEQVSPSSSSSIRELIVRTLL